MQTIETQIADLVALYRYNPTTTLRNRIERLCRIAGLPTQVRP